MSKQTTGIGIYVALATGGEVIDGMFIRKALFASTDRAKVEAAAKALRTAGIEVEVVEPPAESFLSSCRVVTGN